MSKELTSLEAFEELKRQIGSLPYTRFDLSGGIGQTTTFLIRDTKLYDIIETALKALEIIRTKQVNISAFYVYDNLEQYNHYCDMVNGCKKLTQEEYDILKEVLDYDV